uniref:Cytokinin-O-glucosyltransferase 2 n=1 Tax=Aegilops tauschii TaxID=37682 RepID=R7W230_AEGTA
MAQKEAGVATSGGCKAKPHAVVVVYPLQGHVIPVTHLALRLAARGFAVTLVNTEAVHDQTARALGVDPAGHDFFAGTRASGMDVRYELVSDGLPVGFDRSLHHDELMSSLLHALSGHVEEVLGRVVVDPAATCLVADTFFVWPATLASKFGIAYVSFWTEPALIFNLYYHVHLLTNNGHFGCNEPRKDTITYIPGVPAIEPHELMSYLQETDTTSVVHRIIFKAFDEARGADYVLCNTVEELEPSTIAALRAEKPFYAVGPIFPAGFARSAVATSMWAESDCSHWLDAQPPGSVLYISFGSYAHVTKQELHEIAGGVLASGARFLWVMRPDIVSSDEPGPLPEGVADASGWRGVAGAFTNRRLVVREWRVGVPIGDRGAVFADEVRARIEGVMSGKEGEELREAVKKMRATLEAATSHGGSSQRSFDEFVDELTCRCGGC